MPRILNAVVYPSLIPKVLPRTCVILWKPCTELCRTSACPDRKPMKPTVQFPSKHELPHINSPIHMRGVVWCGGGCWCVGVGVGLWVQACGCGCGCVGIYPPTPCVGITIKSCVCACVCISLTLRPSHTKCVAELLSLFGSSLHAVDS